MARGRTSAWVGMALAVAACSGPSFEAHLDDAGGLSEGSPVQVAGARVGRVKGVRLIPSGEVEIAFALDRGNELQLHPDACAVVVPSDQGPHLEVMPGDEPGRLGEGPIPRCPLPTEELGALGAVLGEGLGRLLGGVVEGMAKTRGGADIVQDVLEEIAEQQGAPLPDAPAVSCEGLRVRVEGTRELPASGALPRGGQLVTLVFANGADHALRVPAVGNARFLSAPGDALPLESAQEQTWRMPFDVPAGGETRVSVVLGADARLARLEVRPVTRVDEPLTTCALSAEGL